MFDDYHGSDLEGFVHFTEGMSEEDCKSDSGDYESYGAYYPNDFMKPHTKEFAPEKSKKVSALGMIFGFIWRVALVYFMLKYVFG